MIIAMRPKIVFARFAYAGNPVEVGVTMYVISVSHISEVDMVSGNYNKRSL